MKNELEHIRPQVVAIGNPNGLQIVEESWLNKNLIEPGKRYLINVVEIDDTASVPGIAQFTINRNDGSKEKLYGQLGVDYPPE